MSDEQKKLVADIEKTFAELRSNQEEQGKRLDAIDEKKLDKMADSISANLEKLQKECAEQKAQADKLEAALSRAELKGEDVNKVSEFEQKSQEALNVFLKTGVMPSEYGFKAAEDGFEIRALSTDVNPDGGYLVRPEFSNMVIDRVFESSPIRQLANVMPISGKSISILIDDDEAGANWAGEGAAGGETDTPQLGLKELVAHKMEAEPKATNEMLQDAATNVEAWLAGKVSERFARLEASAFVNGSGVNQPRGFLTYDAAADADVYERNKIGQKSLGATSFDATAADGLIEMQGLLKEKYQPNATWGMKRASYSSILKTKGADNYFFSQTLLKDGVMQAQLLGKPVSFMDDMPAEASAALAVVYADFAKAYTIADRRGITVLRDPYTGKGFVKFYSTKRVGGDVTSFDAIKLGKLSV